MVKDSVVPDESSTTVVDECSCVQVASSLLAKMRHCCGRPAESVPSGCDFTNTDVGVIALASWIFTHSPFTPPKVVPPQYA